MQESILLKKKKRLTEEGLILDISARSGQIQDAFGRQVTINNVGINQVLKPTGPVMAFGGNGYLTVPNNDGSLWLPGDFCIDFWVYLISRTKSYPAYFGNYDAWPNANGMSLFAGHVTANGSRHVAAITGAFPAYIGNANLVYGSWRHYATERKGNVIKTYVNGVQEASYNSGAVLHGTKNRISIGAPLDDLSSGINGFIERYRIFNGVRYDGPFVPEHF